MSDNKPYSDLLTINQKNYLNTIYNSKKHWSSAYRGEYETLGINTNNACEVTFRTLKKFINSGISVSQMVIRIIQYNIESSKKI